MQMSKINMVEINLPAVVGLYNKDIEVFVDKMKGNKLSEGARTSGKHKLTYRLAEYLIGHF